MQKTSLQLHFSFDYELSFEDLQDYYFDYCWNKEDDEPDYTFEDFVEALVNGKISDVDFYEFLEDDPYSATLKTEIHKSEE